MRKSRKRKLTDKIQEEVIEDEDFKRLVIETSEKLDIPLEVVKGVIEDFVLQFPLFIYPLKKDIRISVFGFFNLNIRKKTKKTTI